MRDTVYQTTRVSTTGSATTVLVRAFADDVCLGEASVEPFSATIAAFYGDGMREALEEYIKGRVFNTYTGKAKEALAFMVLYHAFGKGTAVRLAYKIRELVTS